ncbi:MAG: hypothetical protein ACREIV_15275 [Planctomycetaceae bacterium]
MSPHRITQAAWAVLLLMGASAAFAQDADGTIDQPAAEPAETKPLSDADEDLSQQLLGEETLRSRPQGDPLEAAIRGMRDAHGRMAQRDTGSETQDIQAQVIDSLDALIDLARQQRQQSPQNQPQQQPQDPQNSDPQQQQQQQREQSGQQPGSQPMDLSGDGGSGQPQQSSDTSAQQTRAAQREAELARRRAMVGEVWGHLPPALRERLLNVDSEKYLPKYEDLTRRYFEALADPERRE